ncbi:unnamed protein product [Penicillium egyptiacum]|uniref:Carrier domain-containing protein n=1 Tax=Penicillium egyptiacum TaxID=1303716 RepID=A0A9W4P7I4_9EURO|nr:unnamed protein product [Penicillium egyptiacum]
MDLTPRDAVLLLFSRSVLKFPHHVAIEDGPDQRVTYQQLDERSTSLAGHLVAIGVRPGEIIPLITTTCIQMVVGVLGILKAGGIYVPIDRERSPPHRVEYIMQRANNKIVVYTGRSLEPGTRHAVQLPLASHNHSGDFEPLSGRRNDVMAIVFTSGTTDKPKGVQIRSSSVARFVCSPGFNYDVTETDRVLLTLSVGFDACLGTMFNTLCNGGTLVLANPAVLLERARECTVIVATPSIISSLGEPSSAEYPQLSRMFIGGETASQALLQAWGKLHVPIWLAYGPTEATCAILTGIIERNPTTGQFHPTHLGRPIPGSTVMLLGPELCVIEADDEPGEICVSGPCLSAGYLEDEARTKEKFVKFRGRTLYRTGDTAIWSRTSEGDRVLEFKGRNDRIAKIHGFLVNLDQDVDRGILQAFPLLRECYSLIVDHMLCTAVVGDASAYPDDLLMTWREIAAAYTVPDHIFWLDTLPLNSNGKVDRDQLLSVFESSLAQKSYHTIPAAFETLESAIQFWIHREMRLSSELVRAEVSCLALGIHSLAAVQLTTFCRQFGYPVSVADILSGSSIRALSLKTPKSSAQTKSVGQGKPATSSFLTPLQHKLVLETKLDTSLNYAQHLSLYRVGDIAHIKAAWQTVAAEEPLFRTTIREEAEQLVQEITSEVQFIWDDVSVASAQDRQHEIVAVKEKTRLGSRFLAIHYNGRDPHNDEVLLVWTTHRALLDGFSAAILFERVDQARQGIPFPASTPFAQAAKELDQLRISLKLEADKFWDQQKTQVPGGTGEFNISNLPSREAPATNIDYNLSEPINMQQLRKSAQRANVTPAVILHAAWALVVSTYTNNDSVIFGIVLSGRDLPFSWASSVIGPLMNQLPFSCRIRREEPVEYFVQRVQNDLREYSRFQPMDGPSNMPPVATMLVVQPPGLKLAPISIVPIETPVMRDSTSVPLIVDVAGSGEVRLVYRTDRFLPQTIQDIGAVFQNVVRNLTNEPQITIQQCLSKRLSHSMKLQLLKRGNGDRTETRIHETGETLSSLFRATVRANPDTAAIHKNQTTVTYIELLNKASRVAHIIQKLVRPGEVVAVLADRSINWIIGIWAVVISNAVYCPIDVSYPASYQSKLLTISNASLLLLPHSSQKPNDSLEGPISIDMESVLQSLESADFEPWRTQRPSDVAYICFTSGSTGMPKGVMCLHRGLVALQASETTRLGSQPGRRIAQFLAPGFGGCLHEVFSALCYGGTLVLRKYDDDMFSHLDDVDVAIITPSVAAEADATQFPKLRYVSFYFPSLLTYFPVISIDQLQVYFGGEAITEPIVRRWWSPERHLYNIYGSTEATILNCQGSLAPGEPICLGGPVPSSRLYILDDHLEMLPPNTIGDIFIAGVQMSSGYINMPERTEQEFITDPFVGCDEKMYRTGDLGYFDHEGKLWYCSRKDRQVKVRGYRVNLDDIALVIYAAVATVRKAVAVAQPQGIALFICPSGVDKGAIKKALHAALPPHYQPYRIYTLTDIPLSPNGKLDLKSLAHSRETQEDDMELDELGTEPLNDTEKAIQDLWKELLHLDPSQNLSRPSDFFALGGDSIAMLKLVRQINATFNIRLTVRDIILRPTLEELATLVLQEESAARGGSAIAEEFGRPLGRSALSPPELLWAHLYNNSQCQSSFNVPYRATLSPTVDLPTLVSSVEQVLNHHTILRSRFRRMADNTYERVISSDPIIISSQVDNVDDWVNRPFSLDEALVRAVATPDTLLFNISHILCDYGTLAILLRDVGSVYYGKQLPPATREYYDESWGLSNLGSHSEFWATYLKGLQFPRVSRPREGRSYCGTSTLIEISGDTYHRLLTLASDRVFTIQQFGLATTATVLQTLGATDDILMGSAYLNHPNPEDDGAVGLHLEPLPIRVRVEDTAISVGDLLRSVATSSQNAAAHALPWHGLLSQLGIPFPSEHDEVFDCGVTFHDRRRSAHAQLDIEGVDPMPVWPEGSLFSILFEWACTEDQLLLRLQYSTDRFSERFMSVVQGLLRLAIDHMLDTELSLADLRLALQHCFKDACEDAALSATTVRDLARKYLIGPV